MKAESSEIGKNAEKVHCAGQKRYKPLLKRAPVISSGTLQGTEKKQVKVVANHKVNAYHPATKQQQLHMLTHYSTSLFLPFHTLQKRFSIHFYQAPTGLEVINNHRYHRKQNREEDGKEESLPVFAADL